jgi:hypothetical protein
VPARPGQGIEPIGYRAADQVLVQSLTAKDTKDAKERAKPYRGGRQFAKEQKSFTAKDAKDAKEEKSFTAKDAKDAKD